MQDTDTALRRRFEELADRADTRQNLICSDFLNLNEQSILNEMHLPVPVCLWGGYAAAERKVAVFGTPDTETASGAAPFVLLKVAPAMQKFADTLSHRDFLGSILGLGLRREMLGDIVLLDNCGYVFCMESIADFTADNLTKVRHTTVRCSYAETLPETLIAEPEVQSIVVASERLDALLAAVFRLSRTEAQALIAAERVFLDSRVCTKAELAPKAGCMVSVRGFGRFCYGGIDRETKKGKLRVSVQIYK